ncbi:outer membrane beta-barrel family protein [Echinicola shivajiensis]|uniref:outer membrane beta-barrel family protein n=1 Tax=Echinicola shivajiensis TaxID=1035916 RepID=UPI001BFC1682|nr:outer membrane beta-barrel family protein [Echinicola shivajiensis]
MKSLYLNLFISGFLFINFSAFSQSSLLKGKVHDEQSGKALEFANIALLDPKDSVVITGGMTDLAGHFEFEASSGEYIFRVGFIGYKSYHETIKVGGNKNLNFGVIKLESETSDLDEILVEGVTSMFESDIDKRRYNVENSIVAEGATASELLETLPSIQVDEEGSISMRGSGNVLIYINGRPSNLSGENTEAILSQFPANSIKEVELITNPSSRYDATGVGGIINIILKKNSFQGLNGQVNASVGNRDKYAGGLILNYGAEKINFFTSYNYQNRRRYRKSDEKRYNSLPNTSPLLDQDSYNDEVEKSHLIRGGFDWNMTPTQVLGFYAQGNINQEVEDETLNQRSVNSSGGLDSLSVRDAMEDEEGDNFETGLTYNWEIDTVGQKVYASFSYAQDSRSQVDTYEQSFYDETMQEVPNKWIKQLNDRTRASELYIAQIDYEKPLGKSSKIEVGLKGTFGTWDRGQEFFQGDINTDFELVRNDTVSDEFTFNEDVYAAYLIFRSKMGDFGYQLGLRGEATRTLGVQERKDLEVVNDYFNLFPSLFLSYTFQEEEELTANFSRRISRPGIWDLAPLYYVSDPLNVRTGNPYLKPEYTNSYEFGYMKGWERWLLNATIYHRYSTDIISRITRINEDNVTIQTRENIHDRSSTGLELINQFQFGNWVDATLTGNLFYSKISGDNLENGANNSNFSWTISLLSNIIIPKVANVQIQGNYRGPIVLLQGELLPYWGMNVGFSRDVLNKKGTISLNFSDIFNTRVFKIKTSGPSFSQDRVYNRETRIVTLSLNYKFGGFKEKRNGRDRQGGGGEEDSEF